MISRTLIFISLSFPPALALAQNPLVADSGKGDSTVDSTLIFPDTSLAEKRIGDIQSRLKEFKASEKATPRFSFYDSLVTYLISERFNCRSRIDQSFYHDAGDYFKFDPSFFAIDYQSTPMRKTVQPYGLTGDRLNVINNGISYTPFEHTVEPDGMVDMNDVPTALDGPVYILSGPIGEIFGGASNVATLLTTSAVADNNAPASSVLVDKGYFGFAFVRGRYARKFSNGRRIDLSASSRKTDGLVFGRDDEQLHYTGSFFFPIRQRFGFSLDAKMYDRDAALAIRPDSGGALLSRHRFDRSLRAGVEIQNRERSARSEFGYRHLRQGSNIGGVYKGSFNKTVNGTFLTHEKKFGSKTLKAEFTADFSDYDNGYNEFHRFNSAVAFHLAPLKKINNISFTAKTIYSDDFDFLPSLAVLYKSEYKTLYTQLSIGYSQKEPSQHQLYLPFRRASLYGSTVKDYSESGNTSLKKENQLIASLTIDPGTIGNHLTLNVTGGRIIDAIEWAMSKQTGVLEVLHFSPVNDNVTFAAVSLKPTFRLSDFLRFNAGGAYFYHDYDSLGDRPYQPEYNIFTGLELHYYWKDRLVHLYAYGELIYTGSYNGYDKQNLGEELLANAKLSLGLKNFRFHLVFQNTFDNAYEDRESTTIPGRFFYYGLTWNFFD